MSDQNCMLSHDKRDVGKQNVRDISSIPSTFVSITPAQSILYGKLSYQLRLAFMNVHGY